MIMLAAQGASPLESYGSILQYSLGTAVGRANTVNRFVFLTLAGASAAVALACGVVPYKTPQYNVNGFAVTNLALKATKAINFNDKFSLPIFVQAIWNPRLEDAHLVFGVTLRP